jgi:hypothetical protein
MDSWDKIVKLQKMIVIYNAIIDGWKVQMLDDGKFEFVKNREKVTTDPENKEFLKDFIRHYMSV